MTTAPPRTDSQQPTIFQALLTGLAYGAVGFAVNWFKVEIFFNVDFLFGSIVTMFALMRFGMLTGVTAALIASACTWHHWHHPWAVVIFSAEAVCTGLFYRKRNWDAVVNNLIFWPSAGIALVLFFYQIVMGFPITATLVMGLKQGINGISNTLLASACYIVYCSCKGDKDRLPSIRSIICIVISLSVVVPAFISLYFGLRQALKEDLDSLLLHTEQTANASQVLISQWFSRNYSTLDYLASTSQGPDASLAQRNLDAMRRTMPRFQRLGIIDPLAVTTAFSPVRDENGASTLGIDLSDRSFSKLLVKAQHPKVLQLFSGRIGTPGPRLILAVPILSAAGYRGAVFGVTDLDSLKQVLASAVQNGVTEITLVDDLGRIVISTRKTLRPLNPFSLPANGTLKPISQGVAHWIPNPQSGIGPAKRWMSSLYVKEVPVADHPGWRLVVEDPLKRTLLTASQHILQAMAGIGALLVLIVLISRPSAKRISVLLSEFERATRQLPEQIAAGATIAWPRPSTVELQGLTDNVQSMSAVLRQSHVELRHLNATLEARVEERTAELSLQQQRLANIILGTNIGTWEWDVQTDELLCNERLADILGYRLEELGPTTRQTWDDHGHPDDLKLSRQLLSWHVNGDLSEYMCESRMKHKDGHWVWVLSQGKIVSWTDDGKPRTISGTVQDISPRKRIEKALRENQELLQAVIETTPDPISVKDRNGRTILVNKACQEYFGITAKETVRQGATPGGAVTVTEQDRIVLDEGKILNFEQVLLNTQGESRCFDVVMGPIWDSNRQVTGIFGISRDITARIIAEEELERERLFLKAILSTIPDLVFAKDTDGVFLMCNPAFEAISGTPASEVIGKTDYDFWPQDVADGFKTRDQIVVSACQPQTNHEWITSRNHGGTVLLETKKIPLYDRAGKLLGILGVARDITQAHEAQEELHRRLALQERLQLIADTAPGVLFEYVKNPDGTGSFPYMSGPVAEVCGFDHEAVKMDGAPFWALVHPEDREPLEKSLAQPGQPGKPVVNEFRLQSPKGELWIKAAAVSRHSGNGLLTWFGFLSDVTTYKEAELVLRESEGMLKKAVALRTEDLRRLAERIEKVAEQERASIAQEIHDELGQLLAALMIDVAWFQKRAPEGDVKYAQKLSAMNDLLSITIQCARRLTRDLRPRMLDELGLVAAVESQLELYRERQIACNIRIPRRDLAVDPERSSSLFRIFQESMTNVMRHSGANRVDVELDISRTRVILQVADNGRGIAPSDLENLESLGLLGIRERVLRWGGDADIAGTPGKGTVIRVTIPIERRKK